MEPARQVVSPYLLVFRDCLQGARSKTSPREIGTVLSKWIEWHDSLEAQGKIRFRGAIGSGTRRKMGHSAKTLPKSKPKRPVRLSVIYWLRPRVSMRLPKSPRAAPG
jgi:hypothetical protein